MDQEKLNIFIHLLRSVRKQPGRTFDLGLIVNESKSKISPAKILDAIKKITDTEKITYDKLIADEEIIEKFIEVFKNNKWVFLEIKKDIGSLLLNQLKHLANYNSFQIMDYKGKDVFEMKIPGNSRVIVFSGRDFIESQITYPHFYLLFGPTLSVEK